MSDLQNDIKSLVNRIDSLPAKYSRWAQQD
jgi:hypothetical protein